MLNALILSHHTIILVTQIVVCDKSTKSGKCALNILFAVASCRVMTVISLKNCGLETMR